MSIDAKWLTPKGIFFIGLFSLAVLLADQVRVAAIWGAANQYFTLFQFIGPIAGGFLGPIAGTVSVLFAEIASFFFLSKEFNAINLLRLTPMLFAAFYFAKFGSSKRLQENLIALIPIVAMLLFITHPIGGQAWYYSLYWLIPVIAALYFKDNLLARSLGATFTAHSIGGIIWLYSVPTTPAFWTALVPIVAMERLAFAAGIALSFVAFNALLSRIENWLPTGYLQLDGKHSMVTKPEPVRIKLSK